ncbi:MAG: DUF3857 domain-containing protein, partial [Bacteroidota bacterium]
NARHHSPWRRPSGSALAGNSSEWAVSNIREDLLSNANSIVRKYDLHLAIEDLDSYSCSFRKVITVLNENGKGPDIFFQDYDPLTRVEVKSLVIYNAAGQEINKVRKGELTDQSLVQGYSLFEDNRFLAYRPHISVYPYTVEVEYTVHYSKGMYYLYRYQPVIDYNMALENARLVVEYPVQMPMIFKAHLNEGAEAEETTHRKNIIKTWSLPAAQAISNEDYAPGLSELTQQIDIAQTQFSFDGYTADAQSWNSFGKWIQKLNEGKDNLPEERIAFIRSLVDTITDKKLIVKAVYEYMQSRTRYLNIALGIGGLQPFDAATVDRNGYGDCKALSNYMKSLLKAVDIPSHYTLVMSGRGRNTIVEGMPVSQFNHVILCVPLEKDTVWLECTSQHAPFGYLGDFTDNRPVLIIREDGGHLVRTPLYTKTENRRISHSLVEMDLQGHARAELSYTRGGIYFDDYVYPLIIDPSEQEQWIYSHFPFPNYTLNEYRLESHLVDVKPEIKIDLSTNHRSVATFSGDRMFLPIKGFLKDLPSPSRVRRRTLPFEVNIPFMVSDTVLYKIPDVYIPESQLPGYVFESSFGKYHINLEWSDGVLKIIRNYENITGEFPADKYKEFYDFYQSIVMAEGQTIPFVRKSLRGI